MKRIYFTRIASKWLQYQKSYYSAGTNPQLQEQGQRGYHSRWWTLKLTKIKFLNIEIGNMSYFAA